MFIHDVTDQFDHSDIFTYVVFNIFDFFSLITSIITALEYYDINCVELFGFEDELL